MKKITFFLIILGLYFNANAQYVFSPIDGPVTVAAGTPETLNLNDVANGANVPASSTGSYGSFSVSVDWTAGGGGPWSSEADLTVNTSAGEGVITAISGAGNSGADTTITFEGDFAGPYDPATDGFLDLVLNQTFGGSSGDWSNIEVTLFESPTCIAPSAMVSSGATTTSIDLNWTAGNTETTWNIEYNGGADFTPGNGEEEGATTANTTPTASLSGLTPFTNYFVYYRADCGAGDLSEWVGPFTFLTGYCESIPSSNDGQGITELVLGSETFTSAGDVTFEDFTSPTVDLAAAVTANMQITFATGFTYDVNVWIDLNNDLVYDNATELVFQGETTNVNPTTFDASFFMPNVAPGVYNMRMGSADFGQATPNPCFTGSFGVTADMTINVTPAPDCIPASALAAINITETEAELTWEDQGSADTYDLEWGPAGFTPGSGTTVAGLTTTSYVLGGLTAGTAYDFYVLNNCTSSSATLTGPANFITATPGETCANAFPMVVEADCSTATPVTFDFSNGGDIDANGENPSCDAFGNFGYFISFTAPAVGSVVIYFDGGADNIGLEVYDSCGGAPVSDCTNNTLDAGDNSGIIGGLTPGNTYVALIWRDVASGTADVCIEEGPSCPFPINLDALNVTESSADLSWTENGSASEWNIEWGPAGFTPGSGTTVTNVTTNPYPLAGLTQNTSYDFYVQAICGASDTSNFSGPFNFTTTPQSSFVLDCATDGPLNQDYCYDNGGANNPFIFTFSSNDGTPLNLVFNSGFVEVNWDELVVLDSDGTPFPGFSPADQNYGNAGDLSGLSFQSTGDTISFYINSDGSISCQTSTNNLSQGINYTVSCATCINPQATYAVIDDCDNGEQFLIDVDITSLGDASSLTISNNLNGDTTPVTSTGVYQIGPFPFLTDVVVTISNDQDVNCVINSPAIEVLACPPSNDNCDGATVVTVNTDETCDATTPGTILAATPSGVPGASCGGNPDDDVWFQFVAENEVQIISILNITGGTTNLDHALYEGSCGSLTEISCSAATSSVTPELTVGNTYFIRVFSGGGDPETSNFELCVREAPNNIICDNAENFCSDGSGALTTSNIVGIPDPNPIACLGTAPNPTWNILQIGESGAIEIEISQEDDSGNGLDVDFVVWGPFTSVEEACTNIAFEDCPSCPFSNNPDNGFYPFGNIVDCSYSASAVENLTIDNAQTGEIYMLLVTNFNGNPGTITIQQTNGSDTDGGTIEAEISAEIISNEVVFTDDVASVCGFDSVTIEADSPFADEFIWFKNGFVIPNETSSTLVVTESDTYQVQAFDDQCGDDAFSQVVTINLYEDPGSFEILSYAVCDSQTGSGEEFDLDEFTTTLELDSQFTISYYTNIADANQAINPVPSNYVSSGETLIVRIEDVNAANNGFLGCRTLTELDLVVGPELCIFPQGISPGVSPGLNDTFDLSNFDVSRLEIFNRNGTLVYSKDNYTNEWVGQSNNGDELPVGTYFYTIVYGGGTKTKSAWVYINR